MLSDSLRVSHCYRNLSHMDTTPNSRSCETASSAVYCSLIPSQNGRVYFIHTRHEGTRHRDQFSFGFAHQKWTQHGDVFPFIYAQFYRYLQLKYERHAAVSWSGYNLMRNTMALMLRVTQTYTDDLVHGKVISPFCDVVVFCAIAQIPI